MADQYNFAGIPKVSKPQGNIDLFAQPEVKNPDGSTSTIDSIGVNLDGKEYLLPTVTTDGRHFTGPKAVDQAIAEFRKTGRHLGVFNSVDDSNAYASQLHNDYAAGKYKKPAGGGYDFSGIAKAAPDFKQSDTTPNEVDWLDKVLSTSKDVAIGAAKGFNSTLFGLGKVFHDYTPVGFISDAIQPGAFNEKPKELEPTNTAQRIGHTVEQVGEFFVPVSEVAAVGKLANAPKLLRAANSARAAEVLKAGGLTMAQGGSPTESGVSMALTAALPGTSAVGGKVVNKLRESAEKRVAQALGATKEWAKTEAAELAPQMLKRGIGGTRATMLAEAEKRTARIGQQIGAEVSAAATRGDTVSGQAFANTLGKSRLGLTLADPATGELHVIPGHEVTVKKLDQLIGFARTLGPDIPVERAQALKQAWDGIVSKAGLYGPKATSTATDNARAWAFREGASSMRKLIASGNPELAALNQEFKFWKGLENILTATEMRTQAQSGGLVSGVTAAAGAAGGFASGDSMGERFQNAMLGGFMGKQIVRVIESPYFRTKVSAPLKYALADAIASGHQGRVMNALAKITSAMPSQVHALAQ